MDINQLRKDLECVAQIRPVDDGETLAVVLCRLDAAAVEPTQPERLKHYLSMRSYLKALEWLDHPETPHYV